jgi:hypothetical protein
MGLIAPAFSVGTLSAILGKRLKQNKLYLGIGRRERSCCAYGLTVHLIGFRFRKHLSSIFASIFASIFDD